MTLEASARELLMRAAGFKPADFTLDGTEGDIAQKVATLSVELSGWFEFTVTSATPGHAPYVVTTDNTWQGVTGCECDFAVKGHHISCKHQERVQIVLDKYQHRMAREREFLQKIQEMDLERKFKAALQKVDETEQKMLDASLTRPAGFSLLK